jgi:hypothetical protein
MPATIIPTLAVLATIAEIFFGVTLLLGIRISAMAIGSSIMLFLFATAMTVSGLSQFAYGVYMMAAGAFAISTVNASWLSVDSFLKH